MKKSETIYEGGLFDLKLDRILLPNGHETNREYVDFGQSVLIVPEDPGGRVVLVSQYRHPTREVLLELPAGKVEPGEEPRDAAVRELEEETGFRAREIIRFGEFYLSPGYSSELMSGFHATGIEPGMKNPDPDEILSNVVLTRDGVKAGLTDGRFRDAKTILGLLWWLGNR